MAKDLVCGMQVAPETAAGSSEYHGKTYYFCSRGCQIAFEQDPMKYISAEGDHADHGNAEAGR